VITATFVVLVASAVGFAYRLLVGPSLTDRTMAVNGLVLTGMGALAADAVRTGRGAFLPTLVVAALVASIATGMIARFIEGRGR